MLAARPAQIATMTPLSGLPLLPYLNMVLHTS